MSGISSILNIGKWALFGNQAAIQTTGSNIANVDTEGYSRRTVRFEESISIDSRPGQIGTGVIATEVVRHFDTFVEAQYTDKSSLENRSEALWDELKSVDSLLNEANSDGISSTLADFFESWQNLAQRPSDFPTRETLLSNTENLASIIKNTDTDLVELKRLAESQVRGEVTQVNQWLERIADINEQISVHDIPGVNNANALLDERDLLVRQVAEKIDVQVIVKTGAAYDGGLESLGSGWALITKEGHTLVDGVVNYNIEFEGPKSFGSMGPTSSFDGKVGFEGESEFEYTLEVVSGGSITAAPAASATFRVSLDGGRTWLTDANGQEMLFNARPEADKVTVGDLDIWFKDYTQPMVAGDKFSIVPKNGLYWYQNTAGAVNITPQILADGSDDPSRIKGGSLAGLLTFSGYYIGQYRDKLEAATNSLIWEVNRLHSQGAGLEKMVSATGSYQVRNSATALGLDSTGLEWRTKLQEGNVTVFTYDKANGEMISNGQLDFDLAQPGVQNFDPATHSIQDVADAFNNSSGNQLTAPGVNNQLRIVADAGYEFAFGTDTAGLLAGLGINTFFAGAEPQDFGLNAALRSNLNLVNAGHVNGEFESNYGDNSTAEAIGKLEYANVSITTTFSSSDTQSILDFYAAFVAEVGGDTSSAKFQFQYNQALAKDLDERQQAVAGVNLDEEMSNLIMYQNSYRAAAKLITTADEMFQVVLGLKQ